MRIRDRSGTTDHQNCAAEAEQSFEKTEQLREQTQGEVDQVMGSQIGPKENGNKGSLGGAEQGTDSGKRTRGGLVRNKIRGWRQ